MCQLILNLDGDEDLLPSASVEQECVGSNILNSEILECMGPPQTWRKKTGGVIQWTNHDHSINEGSQTEGDMVWGISASPG